MRTTIYTLKISNLTAVALFSELEKGASGDLSPPPPPIQEVEQKPGLDRVSEQLIHADTWLLTPGKLSSSNMDFFRRYGLLDLQVESGIVSSLSLDDINSTPFVEERNNKNPQTLR